MSVPAVILAGGLARRMGGGDKGLLALGGRPVLEHVIHRLPPQVAGLAINANGDPKRFAVFGLPVLADPVEGRPGPLAGILAAMEWAAERGADRVLTVAADTPFLPTDLVARLVQAHSERQSDITLAATVQGDAIVRHPTIGIHRTALRAELRAALARGTRRVTDWTDAQGASVVLFDEPGAFFNINTPQDLATAQAMLAVTAMP
ncbi:molybdenum cofactor guanylyltransferase MobA [Acuticoccus sp.]|uniref:molybdenum cofactor guanylyltransferase MobA n=1 Tax=Acuticoccus sp. TaxID=1904378 RepID=UPI003B52454B